MVTGGGYTRSDAAHGHWDLVKKTAFIGNTQNSAANPFASNAGPFNPGTGLGCDHKPNYGWPGNYCLDAADGVSFAKSNFALNQRMFSIYDGPAYEDSNAYLDVTRTSLPSTNDVDGCTHNTTDPSHNCANSKYAQVEQVKKFVILDHDLSQETGELTPTLKVKRNVVNEKYQELFDSLY